MTTDYLREAEQLVRAAAAKQTDAHMFIAVHDGIVMEFGEERPIYHGVCLCGYRTLGFGEIENAAAAVERHVEQYA